MKSLVATLLTFIWCIRCAVYLFDDEIQGHKRYLGCCLLHYLNYARLCGRVVGIPCVRRGDVSEPSGKAVVDNTATPEAPMGPVPSVAPPVLNVTILPTGNPPLLVKVALNVTDLPSSDGFGEGVSVIVVVA